MMAAGKTSSGRPRKPKGRPNEVSSASGSESGQKSGTVRDFTKTSRIVPLGPAPPADPATVRSHATLALLESLIRNAPPPETKCSPFAEDDERYLRSIISGPNGVAYIKAIRNLIATPSEYYRRAIDNWLAQFKRKLHAERMVISLARKRAKELPDLLEGL